MDLISITLNIYGMPLEQRPLSGFDDRGAVRGWNPLGRIPARGLDGSETLVDSVAIIDHFDEVHGRERALAPPSGAERRAVQGIAVSLRAQSSSTGYSASTLDRRPPRC
jgi:glutathione S-transferase